MPDCKQRDPATANESWGGEGIPSSANGYRIHVTNYGPSLCMIQTNMTRGD